MIRLSCAASGSSGNCYSLTDESGNILLLDAGILLPEIKKLVNWKTSSIIGAFISHDHNDHSKSADKLRKMGIPVFEPYKGGKQSFMSGGWKMASFDLPHDGVDNRGCFIVSPDGHKMVYLTDFEYCPYIFHKQKLNTFLIECNHLDDIDKDDNEGKFAHVLRGHSSLGTVLEFLRINKTDALKTVVLCHLSTDNADPDEMVRRVQEVVGTSVRVFVARKGVTLDL